MYLNPVVGRSERRSPAPPPTGASRASAVARVQMAPVRPSPAGALPTRFTDAPAPLGGPIPVRQPAAFLQTQLRTQKPRREMPGCAGALSPLATPAALRLSTVCRRSPPWRAVGSSLPSLLQPAAHPPPSIEFIRGARSPVQARIVVINRTGGRGLTAAALVRLPPSYESGQEVESFATGRCAPIPSSQRDAGSACKLRGRPPARHLSLFGCGLCWARRAAASERRKGPNWVTPAGRGRLPPAAAEGPPQPSPAVRPSALRSRPAAARQPTAAVDGGARGPDTAVPSSRGRYGCDR
ncbi:uncharacterized protein LOC124545950 [Schistocerca americana]|uniref:uncharacterized protein LOC124545950 n=1 Tax=Schistocerca americana TaxID=7009 RepID=UPI001F4F63E8|nr:uncharacterized protein LOC124545950 [Schistocerca americana]